MRYAIYWTPAADTLFAQLAHSWLGRETSTGATLPQPHVPCLSCERREALTREPRRYGLHATLKAPFRLKSGCSPSMLEGAVEAFARGWETFSAPPLVPRILSDFAALVPAAESPALHALAAACVREFESFRAPLTAEEISRRKAVPLSEGQEDLLRQWGYPYVFEEFRFHLSLTGRSTSAELSELLPWLRVYFAPIRDEPTIVESVSIFVQEHSGAPFHILRRFPLKRSA